MGIYYNPDKAREKTPEPVKSLSLEECIEILRSWGVEMSIENPICHISCSLLADGSIAIDDDNCYLRFKPVRGVVPVEHA